MTLLRWFFGLTLVAVLLWFSATVELGSRTLIEHVRAIAGTREAAELAQGTKDEAGRVADRVHRALAKRESTLAPRPLGEPSVRTVERPVHAANAAPVHAANAAPPRVPTAAPPLVEHSAAPKPE